jgi:hypothetical protein
MYKGAVVEQGEKHGKTTTHICCCYAAPTKNKKEKRKI